MLLRDPTRHAYFEARLPDPPCRYVFDESSAVFQMLQEGVLLLGPDDDGVAVLDINYNDIIIPAADSEPLPWHELEALYAAACDPRPFALVRWLCKRAGERPMELLVAEMKAAGAWDEEMEALDAVISSARAAWLPPIKENIVT